MFGDDLTFRAYRDTRDYIPRDRVYLIGYGSSHPLKIGYSYNISRRINDIQKTSPYRLHLFKLVQGGMEVEQELHRLASEWSIGYEWYKYSPSVLALFDNFPKATLEQSEHESIIRVRRVFPNARIKSQS